MMVDRISDLTDELLYHILSFLPTKLAFSTTVLSKRWTGLCYSLPALHFEFGLENCGLSEQHVEDTFYRFSHFVDTLMLSHLSTNKPPKTFLLICPFGKGEQYSHIFSAWFEAAKLLRVEEFHLTMFFHILNPITFISQTLVVHKLTWVDIGNDTSCVDLPSLKTLHLRYVYFENRNDYIGFLSACPNLEDLHTEHVFSRKPAPKNISKGLKGSANDLRYTKYLLQNVSLLQDMKISITTTNGMLLGNLEKSQIREELSSCPRISLGCKLSFE